MPETNLDGDPTRVVVGPHFGEFGWEILHHVRFVEQHPAKEKIVCITDPSKRCLYPSATDFYVCENPIPDANRQNDGSRSHQPAYYEAREKINRAVRELYPEHQIIAHPAYDCYWHWSDLVKPRLSVEPKLPAVDVVVSARKRDFGTGKNWPHWTKLVRWFKAQGLSVGLVGEPDTTVDVEANAKAWEHPEGATAGTVDLLAHCKLFVTSDTGVAHLGAMMDVPQVIFRANPDDPHEMTGVQSRANKRYCKVLDKQAALHPEWVFGASMLALRDAWQPSQFYAQHGEDRWIAENLKLPTKGVFVEVGAANGIQNSNTRCFEQCGWTGLCIEPDPRSVEQLKKHRRCEIESCAIGSDPTAKFYMNADPQLSGFDRRGTETPVTIKRLDEVLDAHGLTEIDLLSIDTEGNELDVWQTFDPEKYRPKVVIIEWDTPGLRDRRPEIREAMSKFPYREVKEIVSNLVFVRTD